MSKPLAVALVVASFALPVAAMPARAQSAGNAVLTSTLRSDARQVPPPVAANVVSAYFRALGKQDEGMLGAVTTGGAASDTQSLLHRIRGEAARRKVAIELQVKNLMVSPFAPSGATTAVRVKYDVAVIARKWLFSKVAKEWNGYATFFVGTNGTQPRIVGIDFGDLDAAVAVD